MLGITILVDVETQSMPALPFQLLPDQRLVVYSLYAVTVPLLVRVWVFPLGGL
jgi:hypothetical protein